MKLILIIIFAVLLILGCENPLEYVIAPDQNTISRNGIKVAHFNDYKYWSELLISAESSIKQIGEVKYSFIISSDFSNPNDVKLEIMKGHHKELNDFIIPSLKHLYESEAMMSNGEIDHSSLTQFEAILTFKNGKHIQLHVQRDEQHNQPLKPLCKKSRAIYK